MPTPNSTPAQPAEPVKRDFRQEVTDRIVKMLEDGVAPWQKPWTEGKAPAGMPMNPVSGRPYRGGNAIHLMATALQRGYDDPRWMTYRQASEQGWQVRGGEKGTQIEFWDTKPQREQDTESDKAPPRPIHRVYTVFNACQIDRIPPHRPEERPSFEVAKAGEEILSNSGASISHDQNGRAFYDRAADRIHLPPKDAFATAPAYYGTALHELAHWSGHPSRLNRGTLNESYRFGDTNYAKEELRAELASVFLAAERGIPHDSQQHAAYVGSWIRALKSDKHEIFRAAGDASRAADYLLALERERSFAGQSLSADDTRPTAFQRETAALDRDRSDLDERPVPVRDEARAIAKDALGAKAKMIDAETQSGSYRGVVLGETVDRIVQRQSSQSAVFHLKAALGSIPAVGANIAIQYSNGHGAVREVRQRSKTVEMGR